MAMASPLSLLGIQQQTPNLQKSNFLGRPLVTSFTTISQTNHHSSIHLRPLTAKFNLSELLGGRGLCNGEEGIEKELKRDTTTDNSPPQPSQSPSPSSSQEPTSNEGSIPESAFEKELLGLTGGFPGGEKGLQLFLEKNPPPKKPEADQKGMVLDSTSIGKKKVKPPELPLLLPGMIALVKNENNPYYMMCGIVQRITDGRAGVLFEGGNWDRLITFRLEELEKREKGPPMVSPRSVMLESSMEKEQ